MAEEPNEVKDLDQKTRSKATSYHSVVIAAVLMLCCSCHIFLATVVPHTRHLEVVQRCTHACGRMKAKGMKREWSLIDRNALKASRQTENVLISVVALGEIRTMGQLH
jgi:hypothetical protein